MSSAEPDETSEPDGEGLLDEAELPPVGAVVLVFALLLADVLLLADAVAEEVVVAVAMMNGATTTTKAPIINTENQTVLLPVEIWLGGMKLNIKASKDPQNPSPPIIHIRLLPFFPIRNGRLAFFML